MKAYVFSIGEKTTDLCCELMREYGFEVILYQDDTSLWEKLKRFYTEALETKDEWFVRIDADVIPNKSVKHFDNMFRTLWTCMSGWDWYKQNSGAVSIHLMNRAVIESCLEIIEEAKNKIRPESYLWRHDTINHETIINTDFQFGIHGYGQQEQRERIKNLKQSRNQEYDWSLVERIESL